MALDQTANFVRIKVSGTHTSSDTTISLASGDASELPDPANGEYNLVWWDDTNNSSPAADPEVEIVRVTNVDTTNDEITVQRGQEDTSAVAHDTADATYRMILASTSKMFGDINDVTNLSGSTGTSGQFLQTDGTNLSFADISGGMTDKERQAFNDLVAQLARNDFADNLSQLNYDGGFYIIYENTDKIASSTDIDFSTLEGGDSNGIAEITIRDTLVANANDTNTLDTASEDAAPGGSIFKPDGTRIVIAGENSEAFYQYDLSTAWDVSTASLAGDSGNLSSIGRLEGVAFNGDGSKVYAVDRDDGDIVSYTCSTNYDISSISELNSVNFTANQVDTSRGMTFNDDGTKMFLTDRDSVYSYDLSTAYDITTATFNQKNGSIAGGSGMDINQKGDVMVIETSAFDAYTLSTNFDISTASFVDSYDVDADGYDNTRDAKIGDSGQSLYLCDKTTEGIQQYENVDLSSGIADPGTFTSITKDLSLSENGGFSNPPSSVVLSQEATVPTDTDLTYTVKDSNGNSVTITQSDVDTEVDISSFTSTTVEITANFSDNGGGTATSDDIMLHFKE